MLEALHIIAFTFQLLVFFYCFGILISYLIIGVASLRELLIYKHEAQLQPVEFLVSSPFSPSISIIAPAYNEMVTITDNIRSLLSLHYNNLTVIVVNDGSKDDTLITAIQAYDLVEIPYNYVATIHTKNVRGVYKSKNPAFKKLLFVDKENGGKADAINVGVNIAQSRFFACIDVDCIIEQDAFLKMVKPILQETTRRVVAVGGVVWLTNDAEITTGKLISLRAPTTYIGRIQVIEYFRAFLLGRAAWSSINGMLLISGAFGIFEREVVLECGGYNHATVGEDMELIMRMHGYLRKKGIPYKIAYVPEPLCWTEAPSSYEILGRQRNRWTRGTMECLWMHKEMFFNPRFGTIGLVSYPYWLLAEWLAPYVEFFGTIFLFIMAIFGLVNWPFFVLITTLVYVFAVFNSMFAVFAQEVTYYKYPTIKDLLQLILTLLLEPFIYHPRTVYWSMKGNYDKFFKKNIGWGTMTRAGFAAKKPGT